MNMTGVGGSEAERLIMPHFYTSFLVLAGAETLAVLVFAWEYLIKSTEMRTK